MAVAVADCPLLDGRERAAHERSGGRRALSTADSDAKIALLY